MLQSERVALITGAGKGLGAAFAKSLALDGCKVMVNNRSHPNTPSSAQKIATELQEQNYVADFEDSPVHEEGAATTIISNTLKRFGRLDVLVLNAGISGPAMKINDQGDPKLRQIMEINFFANTALIDAALPYLRESSAGRIVFIASSAGLYGVRGRAPYAASKAALIAYAKTLADELSRTNIRVNIIAPYAATNMTSAENAAVDEDLHPSHATAAATWFARPDCHANGQVWMAGAKYFARSATIEGIGGGCVNPTPDWFGEHINALSSVENGTEFSGAEAAFAHFYKKAKQNNHN